MPFGRRKRAPRPPSKFPAVFRAVRARLQLSQTQIGKAIGVTPRSVMRWEQERKPTLAVLLKLIRFIEPRDKDAAEQLATAAGVALEVVGVQASARRNAFDSALLAAAEALDLSPRALRPGLRAALERLSESGLTLADALAIARAQSA